MACRFTRWLILALATPLLAADCFFNTDWQHLVQGRPVTLAWDSMGGGSFWDIFLTGDVRSQASIVGPIARMLTRTSLPHPPMSRPRTLTHVLTAFTGNITQNSVVWQPPDHIRDGNPDRLFAAQLWDLARGTVCNSPSFTFKARSSDEPSESVSPILARLGDREHGLRSRDAPKYTDPEPQLPPGPLITTSVSLEHGAVNVEATIAPSFTTGGGPLASSSTPTPTSTAVSKPEPTNESAKRARLASIIAGTVFGTIFAVLIVCGLLWRARGKRAKERDGALPNKVMDETPPTAHDSMAELGESGTPAVARTELQDDQEARSELEADMTEKRLYEMPAISSAPVELPAEMPAELLARHADAFPRHSMVSALTDSRRPSLDRSQVSLAILDPKRDPSTGG